MTRAPAKAWLVAVAISLFAHLAILGALALVAHHVLAPTVAVTPHLTVATFQTRPSDAGLGAFRSCTPSDAGPPLDSRIANVAAPAFFAPA